MGMKDKFGRSSNDDSNDETGNSVSYIYIRQPGHKSNGEGFNPTGRDKLRGEGSNFPADSMSVSKVCKKHLPGYGSQHDFFSQVVSDFHTVINEDDYTDLFETFMVDEDQLPQFVDAADIDGDDLAQFLMDNPDLLDEVRESLNSAADGDDEGAAPASADD